MEFLQPGHLVEISGTPEEGFPASYVTAMILSCHMIPHMGANVRFLEFIDDKAGEQLEEFIAANRIRPAPPAAAHFSSFEDIEARLTPGEAVEMYQDDVWWKGLVLRKTPAGVFIYMPGFQAPSNRRWLPHG
eukprot:gene9455-9621_t